jgi:hypothetical protein
VVATLTFNKSGVMITNANFTPFTTLSVGDSVDYLFTGNGYYLFTFIDPAGNTGQATAVVNRIDKLPPQITSLTYTPSSTTNQDVVATITLNEPIQPPSGRTALDGNAQAFSRTFTGNTSLAVSLLDLVGNQTTTGITIDRIDKSVPEILLLAYDPSTLTNGNVVATLITNKPIQQPIGRSGTAPGNTFTKTFTENISTFVIFTDLVGNQNYTGIEITRIDRGDLTGHLNYTPNTPTSGDVVATLTFNKT